MTMTTDPEGTSYLAARVFENLREYEAAQSAEWKNMMQRLRHHVRTHDFPRGWLPSGSPERNALDYGVFDGGPLNLSVEGATCALVNALIDRDNGELIDAGQQVLEYYGLTLDQTMITDDQ